MATKEDKELWLEFAHDAASMYSRPDDLDEDEAVDDAAEFASGYADAMLDALDARYDASVGKRRRKPRKDDDE